MEVVLSYTTTYSTLYLAVLTLIQRTTMTINQAKQLRCPYKPYVTDLDSQALLPTCQPQGCMCWVSTSKVAYTDKQTLTGNYDQMKQFLLTNPSYVHISTNFGHMHNTHTFGIPQPSEQGYCTLRGDIDDSN